MSVEDLFRTFPILPVGDDLILRQIRPSDAERYLEYI